MEIAFPRVIIPASYTFRPVLGNHNDLISAC